MEVAIQKNDCMLFFTCDNFTAMSVSVVYCILLQTTFPSHYLLVPDVKTVLLNV